MMKPTPNVPGLAGINREQGLFVIPGGSGYSTLGFDVAHRWTAETAQWLKRPDLMPPARKGTVKAWKAYRAAMEAGRQHNARTGERCSAELTPALVGLEGRRVEVQSPNGERRRFWVGKSTGWSPCHLEIARRNSMGGIPVYVPPGSRVVVVSDARR